jgi:hypothetical protein
VTRAIPSAVALAAALAMGGCGPRAKPPSGPLVAPVAETRWRTMRAEHQVAIDVTLDDGRHEQRTLRGLIAVEQPSRFRLRAFGPGGITLFDVLHVDGKTKVIEAIRDPNKSVLGGVIESMAGDLSAAFGLRPGTRSTRTDGDVMIVEEPARTVKLSKWKTVGAHAVPTRIDIVNKERRYTVGVDAGGIELDSPLDPAMFQE